MDAAPLTEVDLAEIAARWASVTPGPWVARTEVDAQVWGALPMEGIEAVVSLGTRFGMDVVVAAVPVKGRPDTQALAHARDDIPRLVDAVERVWAEVAALRGRLARLEAVEALAREVAGSVEAALQDAIDEERAACAALADTARGADIAAAIRARP